MKLTPRERFSDLTPEDFHQSQQRIAAAFGVDFAALLGDDETEPSSLEDFSSDLGPACHDQEDQVHIANDLPSQCRETECA